MRILPLAILVGVWFAKVAWAQPQPPPLPPLPPRPELPHLPPLPGPDHYSPQNQSPPAAGQEIAPIDAPPYEPPRAKSQAEKRLRDVVFGLVCIVPLGLAGAGLIALTQWKKPHLSGRLYARGLVMGALLVFASLFMGLAILLRLLFGFELRDLWS